MKRAQPLDLWRSILCGIALLSLSCASLADDFSAIRATVFDYFDGINEVSEERLLRAFTDTAALKSIDESGELLVEPIADAIERWMKNAPKERSGRILSIDVSGESIARVTFDFNGTYLDFLTLAKLHSQWKIIDKVFVQSVPPCCTAQAQ